MLAGIPSGIIPSNLPFPGVKPLLDGNCRPSLLFSSGIGGVDPIPGWGWSTAPSSWFLYFQVVNSRIGQNYMNFNDYTSIEFDFAK